jgi:hypothetical protein
MSTKVMTLNEFAAADPIKVIQDCCNSHATILVECPDHRVVRIETTEDDDFMDRLIESNAEFRQLLKDSAAGPWHPFPLPKT